MKKIILLLFVAALAVSAQALDFFGITHEGNTTDSIINLIHSIAQGNGEHVLEYQGRLMKTAPEIAKSFKTDDLKLPCFHCKGTGIHMSSIHKKEEGCPVCGGDGLTADQHALGYLQHKFSMAIEEGKSDEAAWKEAKTAFDKRKKLVLNRERMFGTVVRSERGGLLLTRQGSDETVWVTGYSTLSRKGTPINGYVWPAGLYTYEGDDGKPVKVKRYVATLWVDFK